MGFISSSQPRLHIRFIWETFPCCCPGHVPDRLNVVSRSRSRHRYWFKLSSDSNMQSWLRTTNLIIPFQHLFSVFLPLLSLPRPALGGFCRMRDSRSSNAFISQRGHQLLRHLCVVPRTASPHTPNHSIRKDLKAHLIQGCE